MESSLFLVFCKRCLSTLLVLCIFRFGLNIFLPFTDYSFVIDALNTNTNEAGDSMYKFFNLLSSGGMRRFSLFSLGLIPYIMSSIFYQLLKFVYKDFFADHNRNNSYLLLRLITLIFTILQACIFVIGFNKFSSGDLFSLFINISSVIGGTFFLIFCSELINLIGFGSGFSLMIFVGIVSDFPSYLQEINDMYNNSVIGDAGLLLIVAFIVIIIAFIVLFEKSVLNITVFYSKQSNMKSFISEKKTFLPIKINMAGVIPVIFASTMMFLPIYILDFLRNIYANNDSVMGFLSVISSFFAANSWGYNILLATLITFFCFFYTNNISFDVNEFANNLKKSGGILLGLRPGSETVKYLKGKINNLILLGSIYLSFVCIAPNLIRSYFVFSFLLGGTSLLIVVGVINELINQCYQFFLNMNYSKNYQSM